MQVCDEACLAYPEWDWIFTTSSSTKIMSLAAYEIAKQRNIPLWLIEPWIEKVISLLGDRDMEVDTQRFFQLTVDEYMASCGFTVADDGLANRHYQSKILAWRNVTQELIRSPDTETFRNLLRASSFTKNQPVRIMLHPEMKASTLLQSLERNGLLEITQDDDNKISCSISYESAHFLIGDWLAFYIWDEVTKMGFANDCRWDFRITNGEAQFEIDLAIAYKTRLLIAECKDAPYTFKDVHLARLHSTANLLGGNLVSKCFITSQTGAGDMFKSFCEKARLRNIVVITKEDLPTISDILKREMIGPKYLRI